MILFTGAAVRGGAAGAERPRPLGADPAAVSSLRAADGLPPFPSDVQASLQAADHVLLQPQVQVEGEVEPGGLVNLPRYAAQAVSSVALNLHRNIEEIIKI